MLEIVQVEFHLHTLMFWIISWTEFHCSYEIMIMKKCNKIVWKQNAFILATEFYLKVLVTDHRISYACYLLY